MQTPREVLRRWIEAFNTADAMALAEMYHEDAVNHQVANEPVTGKESIAEMFRNEFAAAEMVCIPVNIFEDGEWAILEWKDPQGMMGCGFFHIINDRIKLQRGYWDKLTFMRLHNISE